MIHLVLDYSPWFKETQDRVLKYWLMRESLFLELNHHVSSASQEKVLSQFSSNTPLPPLPFLFVFLLNQFGFLWSLPKSKFSFGWLLGVESSLKIDSSTLTCSPPFAPTSASSISQIWYLMTTFSSISLSLGLFGETCSTWLMLTGLLLHPLST